MSARLALLAALSLSTLAAAQTRPTSPDQLFGLNKIWNIRITVHEGGWEKLFPAGGMTMGFAQRRTKCPYIKVRMEIAGHAAIDVGLRFKGNSTLSTSRGTLKRPFKIDFDRFVKQQSFLGLKKLNLNNNATDRTQIKDAVCYAAFEKCGVPAPRTAFARVYITIPGRTKRAYVGLYTIVEQVDGGFLQGRLKKKGTILKPETKILGYYGDQWNAEYDSIYLPKTKVAPEHAKSVIALARLAEAAENAGRGGDDSAIADPELFAKAVEQVMDVDNFLRYVAVTSILRNWDNPLVIAHNVYLVIPEGETRVQWVPWDFNLALSSGGGFGRNRSNSVLRPGRLAFAHEVIAVPRFHKLYRKHLKALNGSGCSASALTRSIKIARRTVSKAIAAEAKRDKAVTATGDGQGGRRGFGRGRGRGRPPEDLVAFVKRNQKAVRDELAGKGPPVMSAQAGRAATTMRHVLVAVGNLNPDKGIKLNKLLGVAKSCFRKLDKNRSRGLQDAELQVGIVEYEKQAGRNVSVEAAAAEALELRRTLDKNRDLKASSKEWSESCKAWFVSWDRDRDGVLRGRELSGSIRR